MNDLYPLKFTPVFKEKIWGGHKIDQVLKQHHPHLNNCGELWAISGLTDSPSMVSNGFLRGNSLNDLVEVYMGDLVGDGIYDKFGDEFPLLFKFINAEDFLSVQVHPGDQLAMRRHSCSGKAEMWYVVAADPGAELISGFNRKTSKEEYLQHLAGKSLKDILNFEKVGVGDVFNVPTGHVHAIGPGILLAEIQQASDITYRIFDWDRIDQAGMTRELHTDLALDAINFDEKESYKSHPPVTKNRPVLLQETEFFTVNLLDLDNALEQDFYEKDSFVAYMCLEGAFTVDCGESRENVSIGESLLVPAMIKKFTIIPQPSCRILETYVK
ncbi:MAG TPA: mannose-6-phosphate isomerase [Bacteroidales bacterium]|nr:class I mannose-6-phosphate isomerase [Bacteroidales bacterium]HPB25522.1 mannose-6-phosphate isomerase [Bacteroidales bacterium]HPI30194.1 mannose-6-phosphate isomerase [Bacteroidales bacterium]HQN16119.1 mannose-6-phosphate isomerase [Bacteroidales bacterium]HQP15614.1 mannose-6-phosphate isomerase [Bacteroidales bacterium]